MMGHRASRLRSSEQRAAGIIPWRRQCLDRAGFPAPLADALANDRRIDLHAVLELVDRGCAPELAARILAPLDDPEGGAP
jgi:hypothetical protein